MLQPTYRRVLVLVLAAIFVRSLVHTAMSSSYDVVVIGSGLAGLTATVLLRQKGLSVALVEKSDKLGGNSIKASLGINGVPTPYQDPADSDSVAMFVQDTIKSGKGSSDPRLVDLLAGDSAQAIDWLVKDCGVDLSKVAKLGGHSHARTHRGSGALPPGFAIVSSLTKLLKDAPDVLVMTQTRFLSFVKGLAHVKGVLVEKEGEKPQQLLADRVVLATGGFLADISGEDSLVAQYRPDLLSFPLTNGQQTTGDGQKIAHKDLGAKLKDMEHIQVHPTGFIQLKDETTRHSQWKFLCGELIRGIGGIMLSSTTGKRFVDELQTRDQVTALVLSHCGDPAVSVIVLSEDDYLKAKSHVDFYVSQLLMFKGLAPDVAERLQQLDKPCSADMIAAGIAEYNTQVPQGNHAVGETFYFGFTTPVLHFSMGGVQVNDHSQVVAESGDVYPNVYAIGEVSAGVHGQNRLGGLLLLECVVFGRRVAEHIQSRK